MAPKRKAVSEPQEGTVRWFSVRWTRIKDEKNPGYLTPDQFIAMKDGFNAQLAEWAGDSKESWASQLEDPSMDMSNMHYQADFHMQKKHRPKALAQQVNGIFRGIEITPCSEAGIGSLRKYSVKSKSRIAGPWTGNKELDAKINPKYDYSDVLDYKSLRPFQQSIVDAVSGPVDDRTINWVCDLRGGVGKTQLGKHLTRFCDAEYVTYGDAKSLTHYVSENMHKKAYVFDLSRCKPADFSGNDIYAVMEGVKNGRLVNLKYLSKKVEQASSHVWVFSNICPNRSAMSDDRWKIWGVTSDFKLCEFDYKSYKADQEAKAEEAALQKLINKYKQTEREKRAKAAFAEWKATMDARLVPVVPPVHVPVVPPNRLEEPFDYEAAYQLFS